MSDNMKAEKVFLSLVGAVLNGKEPSELPDGITADDIFAIGSRQDMAPITFCALNSIKNIDKGPSWTKYQNQFLSDCMRSEIQMSEYEKLVRYLCSNGVKILPLKGCVLKNLYPVPNLRVMADVDLLYDGVSSKKLAELMEKAGYSTENLEKGKHDVFYKKPCMNIELHRTLVPDESPYRSVLQDMFSRAVSDEEIPNLYHMKPEDLYIHVIVHATAHFETSGLGIRPMGDLYVLNQIYKGSFDWTYIRERLTSVGLAKFEEKLRTLAYAFFGEEEKMEEVSEMDLDFFFRGGTYGSGVNSVAWTHMAHGGKSSLGCFLKRTFLPYGKMREMYPALMKTPVLLPFAWVYRAIDVLLHRRENLVRVAKADIKSEDVEYVTQIMQSFGLRR